jgi:hypothetical protein
MNAGQPTQFQQNPPNTHQYMIRPSQQQPPQQMPNMSMKPGQPQNVPPGQMQPRMAGPPGAGMQQAPRLIHSNFANSPQYSQPGSGQNVQMAPSMQGKSKLNTIIYTFQEIEWMPILSLCKCHLIFVNNSTMSRTIDKKARCCKRLQER